MVTVYTLPILYWKKGRLLLSCEMLLTARKSEMHWEFCKIALGNGWKTGKLEHKCCNKV